MTTNPLIRTLRQERPKLALQADHGGSRRAAIHLFCLECVGGQRALAVSCGAQECSLWPYRPGASGERDPGVVPTEKEYKSLVEEKLGPERLQELRERGAAMGRRRVQKSKKPPTPPKKIDLRRGK